MEFQKHDHAESWGKGFGFFLGYMVFFSMFYVVVNFLGKMHFEVVFTDYILVLLVLFACGKAMSMVVNHVKS